MELHLVGNMTTRKIHTIITCSFVALFQVFVFESTGVADTGMEFSAPPPFITEGAPPLVMLTMGRDHKLYYEAYNDASDLDEDGELEVRYKPSIDYYGYFDSYKCYDYNTGLNRFEPTSVNSDKKCVGTGADDKWSGNFLNYITMARMDAIRKVLYGGYRSTDTATETVLQRTIVPQDAHSWGKEYTSIAVDGYDIADYTPFSAPIAGTRHLFANTTAGGYDQPPLLRYSLNNKHRIWSWVSRAAPQAIPSAVQTYSVPRPNFPNNHAEFESLVLSYAVSSRLQGSKPWQSYAARNKVAQRTPAPSAANFGAIDGSGNPFKPSTYGPTDTHPSSTYQAEHAEQSNFMLIFTGTLHVTRAGTYTFGVDGDDSVEVVVDGGTPKEHVVGFYGAHGVRNEPMCHQANGLGGKCSQAGNPKPVALTAGAHRVEFRYMEGGGQDQYYLYWKGPDSGNAWRIIPNAKFTDLTVTGYDLASMKATVEERHVKVKVCDPVIGLEKNCHQYPNGNYKPRGLLQENGENGAMYFGLMTGSYAKNASGGVLRKRISSITDEIDTNTGIFKAGTTAVGSIIQTIDKLRVYGYTFAIENPGPGVKQPDNANTYSRDKCGWIVTPLYDNTEFIKGQEGSSPGKCSDWGNPIAEIMYEAIRYFAGKKQPTPSFDYGNGSDIKDTVLGLPKATWNDPYDKNDGGFEYCSKPFLLVLSDINPSYDTDQLPGVAFSGTPPFSSDLSPAMHVGNLAKTISTHEGLAGQKFIGQSGNTYNSYCSAKDMTAWGLGAFRGLCPEEPTKRGGYYAASVAYYGRTTDLSTAQGEQKLSTYAVALASPLPEIKVYVGPQRKLISLVPFGKTVGTRISGGSQAWRSYAPSNTIVDFYVEEISPTHGNFQINFEDVEQGADHDMDALATYEYWLVDNNGREVTSPERATQLKVTVTSTQASGSYIQHLGYIISGTGKDGPYLEVCDADTSDADDITSEFDTPPGYNTPPGIHSGIKLPKQTTRFFSPGGGANSSTASLLKNPLWYAGKWGGFKEASGSGNNIPDNTSEWDADGDGSPDNYFFVVNPLKLEEQLRKAFLELRERPASGTAPTVAAGSQSGEGAMYQALFYPQQTDINGKTIAWSGEILTSLVDTHGNQREDTNGNGRVDVRGPDLNGDGRIVHEDVNMNCQLDQVVDAGGNLITEDSNGNGRLDTEYGASCTPSHSPASDPFLSQLDAIVVFDKGSVHRYYDANCNGVLDPQEKIFNVAVQPASTRDIKYLWSTTEWLNSISDTDIVTQRPLHKYISNNKQRYIFTWADKPDHAGVRNGVVDAGEIQDFIWTPGTTATDLANPGSFYSYLNLYSSFNDRPSTVESLTTTPGIFNDFLVKQTERQVNWLRGLDDVSSDGKSLPLILGGKQINGTELRARRFNGGTWRLGDIIYSTPTLVTAPSEGFHLRYKDLSYENFYHKYRSRRGVLYVGANDGMLHAFNAGFYSSKEKTFCRELNPSYDPFDLDTTNDAPCVDNAATTHPELGAELWAYVPYNLLPHLYWQTENNYGGNYHVYYVDQKPRVFDAQIFKAESVCASDPKGAACVHPDGWGTLMVVGMRLGGASTHADLNKTDGKAIAASDPEMRSAFILLDITNPEAPPTLLGEIAMPKMGFSTSFPTMLVLKDGNGDGTYGPYDSANPTSGENRWFLAFGSGPADVEGSPDRKLLTQVKSEQRGNFYLVDMVKLSLENELWSLTTDANGTSGVLTRGLHPYLTLSGADEGNSFISNPTSVDFNLDYNTDVVYYGTVSGSAPGGIGTNGWGGKLRRIVVENKPDPKNWIADSILYNAGQPITVTPVTAIDSKKRNWIFFGTGRYLDISDRVDISTQSFYGIKEPLFALPGGQTDPTKRTFAEVASTDLVNTTNYRVLGDANRTVLMDGTASTWQNLLDQQRRKGGWKIDFLDSTDPDGTGPKTVQRGERNISKAILVGGALSFSTFIPAGDVCDADGKSFFWARYFETGTDYYKRILSQRNILYGGKQTTENVSRILIGSGGGYGVSGHVNPDGTVTATVGADSGSIKQLPPLKPPFQVKSGKYAWEVVE